MAWGEEFGPGGACDIQLVILNLSYKAVSISSPRHPGPAATAPRTARRASRADTPNTKLRVSRPKGVVGGGERSARRARRRYVSCGFV